MKIKSFPPAVAHPPRFASLLHLTNALRRRQTALGLAALAVGLAGAHSANFPAQGDDVTPSMGLFRINIEPSFRSLMEPSGPPTSFVGYVGYNSAAGRLTSPTLVDRTTEIGRSGRNIRFYPFPGAGIPVGAGSWDTISGYSAYPAIPLSFFAAPANTAEVLTEIKRFVLETTPRSGEQCTNADPRVPTVPMAWPMVKAGTFAGVSPRSLGMAQGNLPNGVPGPDFPARSFFDVFVEVNLPPLPGTASGVAFPATGAVLTNGLPLTVTNYNLTSFPPTVIYIHGESVTAVPLRFKFDNPPYWAAGDLFGSLVLAGHGTFPPDCASEAALAAAVLGPLGTAAPELPTAWLRPTPLCPAPGSSYDSVRDEDVLPFTIPGAIVLTRNFVHTGLVNPITPPPPNGSALYSASNSTVLLEFSIDGNTWLPAEAFGPVQVKISNTNPPGTGPTVFQTEMLQLNLVGNTPFGPMRLRESPTRASLGKLTMQTDPRGYRISSFFDVFLDLSTDNGQTWVPAQRSIRVQASAPQPGPNRLFVSHPAGTTGLALEWLGQYQLLASPKINGPYTPVTGAAFDGLVSHFHQPLMPNQPMMFYRLSQ